MTVPGKEKKKSVLIAYVCWLFGGIFGLHLFYLERDAHAFLTWSTFGGYGIGWLADITKIPKYVRDCNEDKEFIEEFIEKLKRNRKPPFSTSRFTSAIMVGYLWGQLILIAIPQNDFAGINWSFVHWVVPLAVGLGVWIVGNIGREKGDPWAAIGVAYLTYLLRWYIFDESVWLTIMVFCSALAFDSFSKDWLRRPKEKRTLIRRVSTVTLCGVLYLSLWGAYFYFNGTITDSNGDEVPIHEALNHFYNSPWWTDLKQSLYDTYVYAQHHGWYEIWKQIIDLSDVQGEQNSYKVLEVSPTASQSEITSQWRKLSREFHPDKVKDPNLQRAAQERFMEIQQAYEILSNIKSKRKRKNKKSVDD
ncbi:PREDICTED: dnaJ homolog subfamily C member 22 [Nicrophorus vespilloides]|uniref:DnaJ homolog subfamily C member 22 n=1 Tax=Nicrophorus vespilloides TaxID=110193 RepID=A0ABM1MAW0_NICVS|nr:PREDICTED: dnaJ homolog subfamily C member 22 [Nicrophorus vespilloides]